LRFPSPCSKGSKAVRKSIPWILLLLMSLPAVLWWVSHKERQREWMEIQRTYDPSVKPRVLEVRLPQWRVVDRCPTCHLGLEEISAAHPVDAFGCTVCHGGNGRALDKRVAHEGLLGGSNPSKLDVVSRTCGRTAPDGTACHGLEEDPERNQANRVPKALMATMTGVITTLRILWNAQDTWAPRYASQTVTSDDGTVLLEPVPYHSRAQWPEGSDVPMPPQDRTGRPISVSGEWADDHWRKFCSRCHLWNVRETGPSVHGEGCSGCHVEYAEDGRYHGGDVTLKDAGVGYGKEHRMTVSMTVLQCRRCHNRSARVALNYEGLMECDGYGTPYHGGDMNSNRLSGGRTTYHLAPDAHFEQGLYCVDCHTANDTMGDGRVYGRMRDQVEISCTDCHGTFDESPRFRVIQDGEAYEVWASRYLKMPDNRPGDRVALTRRDGVLINVKQEGSEVVLYSKVTGKRHRVPVITQQSAVHGISGHEPSRMECYSCHTRWAPQCYGCHDYRREGGLHYDAQARRAAPGVWSETRSHYRFERPALGRNSRGRVAPFIPGCQVLFTALDSEGKAIPPLERHVFRGELYGTGVVSTPTFPHTVRRETPACRDCHDDPRRLGLGEGVGRWERGAFEVLSMPHEEGAPVTHSLESLVDPEGRVLQGSSHEGAGPFTRAELERIRRVNACLVCHENSLDPIYRDFQESLRRAGLPEHRKLEEGYFEGRVEMKHAPPRFPGVP